MAQEINLTPTASFLEIRREPSATEDLDGGNNAPVPARTWGTAPDCLAGALLVHGLGAHSGWFEALGRRLKVHRVFALAYDQVGFGKRRHEPFRGRKQWLDDLALAYRQVQSMIGDRPLYIMGNSMGALVALRAVSAINLKPAGIVMFSPGFDGHPKTFGPAYRVRAIGQALLRPESEIALPYTIDMVTREEGVRNWVSNDNDKRFSVPAGMLLELLKLTNELGGRNRIVSSPVLMMHAGVDKIVDTAASKRVYQALQSPSKQERTFESAWHDLMFDPCLDELTNDVVRFISNTSNVAPDKLRL